MVKFWLMRSRRIKQLLDLYNLQAWKETDRFVQYVQTLPEFLGESEDFVQAYYDFQMEDFDYHMWSFDFCFISHVSTYGPIFIYTYEGQFLRNQYSEEALDSAVKLFGNRIL